MHHLAAVLLSVTRPQLEMVSFAELLKTTNNTFSKICKTDLTLRSQFEIMDDTLLFGKGHLGSHQ
jgi:hypothetical protein